ncbi:MAG: MotA/TolQ/ExbB proton channel family protein [Phycisphaerae bacterium]|jgi:chemotaxis protein MotA|nr:MotA/TolQ/ExbB proton channel family protein [Phycisphaerae bacterium]
MDIATVCGIILGFVVIIGTILYEGNLAIFFNVPALAIVGGGMTCATMIHFSLPQFLGIFSVIRKTFVVKLPSQSVLIQKMVNFSAISRRDGALALEQEIHKLNDPFFARGLQMLVDGQEVETIREIMSLEIQYLQERHAMGKKILEFMGSSCPSFAMVGTLIGLISMLSKMESPAEVGRGMSVALVCTFYGALFANLVLLPLGGKLGQYSKAEAIVKEMIVEGICAIAKGENPTAVREKMHVFVSSKHREDVKAKV